MKRKNSEEVIDHKVLIFPAMTSTVDGKQVYFLFSLYQVEDIQRGLTIYDVPFSAPFIEGIAVWRGLAIPVISLERYVGLPRIEAARGQRLIIVRIAQETQKGEEDMRVAIRTERETRMISVPDTNALVKSNGWVNYEHVKGIFDWDRGYIVVPETDKMFLEDINYNELIQHQ